MTRANIQKQIKEDLSLFELQDNEEAAQEAVVEENIPTQERAGVTNEAVLPAEQDIQPAKEAAPSVQSTTEDDAKLDVTMQGFLDQELWERDYDTSGIKAKFRDYNTTYLLHNNTFNKAKMNFLYGEDPDFDLRKTLQDEQVNESFHKEFNWCKSKQAFDWQMEDINQKIEDRKKIESMGIFENFMTSCLVKIADPAGLTLMAAGATSALGVPIVSTGAAVGLDAAVRKSTHPLMTEKEVGYEIAAAMLFDVGVTGIKAGVSAALKTQFIQNMKHRFDKGTFRYSANDTKGWILTKESKFYDSAKNAVKASEITSAAEAAAEKELYHDLIAFSEHEAIPATIEIPKTETGITAVLGSMDTATKQALANTVVAPKLDIKQSIDTQVKNLMEDVVLNDPTFAQGNNGEEEKIFGAISSEDIKKLQEDLKNTRIESYDEKKSIVTELLNSSDININDSYPLSLVKQTFRQWKADVTKANRPELSQFDEQAVPEIMKDQPYMHLVNQEELHAFAESKSKAAEVYLQLLNFNPIGQLLNSPFPVMRFLSKVSFRNTIETNATNRGEEMFPDMESLSNVAKADLVNLQMEIDQLNEFGQDEFFHEIYNTWMTGEKSPNASVNQAVNKIKTYHQGWLDRAYACGVLPNRIDITAAMERKYFSSSEDAAMKEHGISSEALYKLIAEEKLEVSDDTVFYIPREYNKQAIMADKDNFISLIEKGYYKKILKLLRKQIFEKTEERINLVENIYEDSMRVIGNLEKKTLKNEETALNAKLRKEQLFNKKAALTDKIKTRSFVEFKMVYRHPWLKDDFITNLANNTYNQIVSPVKFDDDSTFSSVFDPEVFHPEGREAKEILASIKKEMADIFESSGKIQKGKPLKTRGVFVSDKLLEPYLIKDPYRILQKINRTLVPDVIMAETLQKNGFKSWDHVQSVLHEQKVLMQKQTNNPKQLAKLEKDYKKASDLLKDIPLIIKGTYGKEFAHNNPRIALVLQSIRAYNVARLLGNMMYTNMCDIAHLQLFHGTNAVTEAGVAFAKNYVSSLINFTVNMIRSPIKTIKKEESRELITVKEQSLRKDAMICGVAVEDATQELLGRVESEYIDPRTILDPTTFGNKAVLNLEKATKWFAKTTADINYNAMWNDILSTVCTRFSVHDIYDALGRGDKAYLGKCGIPHRYTKLLKERLETYAEFDDKGNLRTINIHMWEKDEATEAFKAAIYKMVESVMSKPGKGETPRWAKREWGKMFFQFKSFGASFYTNVLRECINSKTPLARSMAFASFFVTMSYLGKYIKALSEGDPYDLDDPKLLTMSVTDILGLPGEVGKFAYDMLDNLMEEKGRNFLWRGIKGQSPAAGLADSVTGVVGETYSAFKEGAPLSEYTLRNLLYLFPLMKTSLTNSFARAFIRGYVEESGGRPIKTRKEALEEKRIKEEAEYDY